MHLIGTAGHIDHGKSALIQALTGIHPARLPEEKKRGMTLDLGYAYLKRPDGETIGFIDVPGHEKLIKNMAAGATGIGIALLVVDSREGPRNQTREHLNILRLLGISQVVPVLTKITGCPQNKLAESKKNLEDLTGNSGVKTTNIYQVDSLDKTGIPELTSALLELSSSLGSDKSQLPLYMPIDRSFTLKGIGSIITGTLYQGSLEKDQKVSITGIPDPVRIKSIHNHNIEVPSINSGHRVGLHPSGIGAGQVKRGQVVLDRDNTSVTDRINATLELLSDSPVEIKSGSSFLFYAGTSETVCRLYLAGKNSDGQPLKTMPRGSSALAQVILEKPVPFFFQQTFLIRSTSPLITIAGGRVLDCLPDIKRKVSGAEELSYARLPDAHSALGEYIENSSDIGVSKEKLSGKFLVSPKHCLELLKDNSTFVTDAEPGRADEVNVVSTPQKMEKAQTILIDSIINSGESLKKSWSYSEAADILSLPAGLVKRFSRHQKSVKKTRKGNPVEVKFSRDSIDLVQDSLDLSPTEEEVKNRIISRLKREGLQTTFYGNFKKNFSAQLKDFNKMLKHLEETGQIIQVTRDYLLLRQNYRDVLTTLSKFSEGFFTVSEFGKTSGISRKYSIPLLEHLDSLGVTHREDSGRRVNQVKLQEMIDKLQ